MLVAAGLAVLPLSACTAGLPARSSGHIGCPESDITISNFEGGFYTRTWTAHCHDKDYFCSEALESKQVACKEAGASATASSPPPPPPSARPTIDQGCQYDTQCKGNRICRNHDCVDP